MAKQLLERLADDLTQRLGRGFLPQSAQHRAFYLTWKFGRHCLPNLKSANSVCTIRPYRITRSFPLSWSHYVKLLAVRDAKAREFYEAEALRGGWTVRQLDRQIGSQFYQRTLLSRNKAAMLTKGAQPRPEDAITPEEELKDPLVLEFLNLKDEYSESELEDALIRHLEAFLLELGNDFTFVGSRNVTH